MIFLFTDFGRDGPYLGQMHAAVARRAPGVPVIDLFNDVPAFDARPAAYLLAAYTRDVAPGDVVVAVVDPGVGTERAPLAVDVDGRWFVGPDNGLLAVVMARARKVSAWRIGWRPEVMSATFHGRDLFAPVGATLAMKAEGQGALPDLGFTPAEGLVGGDFPAELRSIAYIDRYGNGMTGWRAEGLGAEVVLQVGDHRLAGVRTFAEAAPGQAFWYANSNGLVEIAVNQGSAAQQLGLALGTAVDVVST